MSGQGPTDLPDYLVEVVARETYERDRVSPATWEDLENAAREGYRETARMILRARAAQSDIKR